MIRFMASKRGIPAADTPKPGKWYISPSIETVSEATMGYYIPEDTAGFSISVKLGRLLSDTGSICLTDVIQVFAEHQVDLLKQLRELSQACEAFDEILLTSTQNAEIDRLRELHGYNPAKLRDSNLLDEVEFRGWISPSGQITWQIGLDSVLGDDASEYLPEEGTPAERLLACLTTILGA